MIDEFVNSSFEETNQPINISVVACGDRVPETLTLLKSALMFTRSKLYFYIFTEANLKNLFIEQVNVSILLLSFILTLNLILCFKSLYCLYELIKFIIILLARKFIVAIKLIILV